MRTITHITLGGAEYPLRPTYAAYRTIEERSGKSLREVYALSFTGQLSIGMSAVVVHSGMIAARPEEQYREEKIAELLFEEGAFHEDTVLAISEFIANLGWTPAQRKKIEEEAARQETETRSASYSGLPPLNTD